MEMRREVEHRVRNGFAKINFSSIKCRFILTKKYEIAVIKLNSDVTKIDTFNGNQNRQMIVMKFGAYS